MAQPIDMAEVRRIAHLARLKLTDDECARIGAQLGNVLDYMSTLNEAATDGVEPTAHPLPVRNVLRDDEPRPSLGVEKVLANAPARDTPYFKVPKVLEHGGA